MTNVKSIALSIFAGGAICGLIYLGLKSNNVNYEEVLAPIIEQEDAAPGMAADAGPSGGSRKIKIKRRSKKVRKSKGKSKK
jgi:hypothetical protein